MIMSITAGTLSAVCGAENAPRISGKVLLATNAASYTYIQVDTGKEKVWAAAPQFAVKQGDRVSFAAGMTMKNFESKTLNRTFDEIYFVDSIEAPGTSSHAGSMGNIPNDDVHRGLRSPEMGASSVSGVDFSGIKKAPGGLTIAEIYKQKQTLGKKQVALRGKVVKFNAQIMKKNWLHVQDGTGSPGANDVTVTTSGTAKVGDVVLVKGTVTLNRDYGHGYKYDLVIEDAQVTVEAPK